MKYNFEVTATIWDENTYIERQLVPLWFDDKTKDKIREVVKEFYEGLSTKEKELYNKLNKDKSVIEEDKAPIIDFDKHPHLI